MDNTGVVLVFIELRRTSVQWRDAMIVYGWQARAKGAVVAYFKVLFCYCSGLAENLANLE